MCSTPDSCRNCRGAKVFRVGPRRDIEQPITRWRAAPPAAPHRWRRVKAWLRRMRPQWQAHRPSEVPIAAWKHHLTLTTPTWAASEDLISVLDDLRRRSRHFFLRLVTSFLHPAADGKTSGADDTTLRAGNSRLAEIPCAACLCWARRPRSLCCRAWCWSSVEARRVLDLELAKLRVEGVAWSYRMSLGRRDPCIPVFRAWLEFHSSQQSWSWRVC